MPEAQTNTESNETLEQIIEAALMAYTKPLSIPKLQKLFEENARPETTEIKAALLSLQAHYETRGIILAEVSSGWRFQVKEELSTWVNRLWDEKPPRYTKAFLETLSLIAYRQPITRGEIEEIRGVAVSSTIVKTMLEREWIRVLGHKEVPGRPAMYGTTKTFLDYFSLKSLNQLPSLMELQDLGFADDEGEDQTPATQPQKPSLTVVHNATVDTEKSDVEDMAAETNTQDSAEPKD